MWQEEIIFNTNKGNNPKTEILYIFHRKKYKLIIVDYFLRSALGSVASSFVTQCVSIRAESKEVVSCLYKPVTKYT